MMKNKVSGTASPESSYLESKDTGSEMITYYIFNNQNWSYDSAFLRPRPFPFVKTCHWSRSGTSLQLRFAPACRAL